MGELFNILIAVSQAERALWIPVYIHDNIKVGLVHADVMMCIDILHTVDGAVILRVNLRLIYCDDIE